MITAATRMNSLTAGSGCSIIAYKTYNAVGGAGGCACVYAGNASFSFTLAVGKNTNTVNVSLVAEIYPETVS